MRTIAVCAMLMAGSAQLHAQQPFADGVTVERGSTRIAYWSRKPAQAAGQVVVNYGRPEWRESIAAEFDEQTKGKIWRMGSNFWSTLDTSLPLRFQGVEVRPGDYYLAVRRSADGARWELLLIDPEAARASHLDAYETATRPERLSILHSLPLRFERVAASVARLTISLKSNYPDDARSARLTISFGSFQLFADFSITTPAFLASDAEGG
jgi:hypothetical protein